MFFSYNSKSSVHSEYDNYNVHTMQLFGVNGRKINRWTISFPLKSSEAWLFHAVSNMIRRNPAGRIPQGDGCVWDGSMLFRTTAFGQETLHPAFVPYIWLGGIERGLAWFADTSFGMKLDRKKKAVRIVRRNDNVILEIDLINRPVTLREGHKVEFGTQSTPVKPIDQRIVNTTFDALGVGVPERPNELTISEHILGYPYRWSKVPIEENWSLFDQLVKAASSKDKSNVVPAVDAFMKKYSAKIRKMYVDAKAQETKTAAAEELIREVLSGGEKIPCETIFSMAAARGISRRTVNEAKKNIPEIITTKPSKKWFWQLPE